MATNLISANNDIDPNHVVRLASLGAQQKVVSAKFPCDALMLYSKGYHIRAWWRACKISSILDSSQGHRDVILALTLSKLIPIRLWYFQTFELSCKH